MIFRMICTIWLFKNCTVKVLSGKMQGFNWKNRILKVSFHNVF